jgi:6-phosphogluconate dehydrogenase
VAGLERGYCLMIGGPAEPVKRLDPIFRALAPGVDSAPRTPGRTGKPSLAEKGYLHCGPSGAGHFVKMVHNGIEYGIMAAYAEGLNILKHANAGAGLREVSAEITPLRDPDNYEYELNLTDSGRGLAARQRGGLWLLDLTAEAFLGDGDLSNFEGRVSDSDEGRWTSIAAIDVGAPAPILTTALYERFMSRGEADFADRVLSAMRYGFGGHEEQKG